MFFAPVIRPAAYRPALRSLDRSFERFFNELADVRPQAARAVELKQDEQSWTLSLDLPGIAKEQLNIGIEGAVVRIETTEEAARQFKAAYELPLEIDASASSAALEHGVLTLTLAKLQPVSKVTPLAIQ